MAAKTKRLKEYGSTIQITRELAFASGQTLVDIRMQHRASTKWSEQDRADAAAKTNALLLYVPASEGGLLGFPFTHQMMEDLGVTAEQVLRSGNKIIGHNGGPAVERHH